MNRFDESEAFCEYYRAAIELIGSRWTGAILRAMLSGRSRFHELAETIPGMSDRMLSERLKELEKAGVLRREVFPETPVRIEYVLTPKGLALYETVMAVGRWAEEWMHAPETVMAG